MLKRSALDCSHVKSVSVMVLTHPDHPGIAGKVVANWSDGSVCTATIFIHRGPLDFLPRTTGQASGYGYDKLSSAVCDALRRVRDSAEELEYRPRPETVAKCKALDGLTFDGAGESATANWFSRFGYKVEYIV
jgi:hypothetical protein